MTMREASESSWNDDWSDPCEQQQGIAIPAFLQPLLGLDFVPYLPTPRSSEISVEDVDSLTNSPIGLDLQDAVEFFPQKEEDTENVLITSLSEQSRPQVTTSRRKVGKKLKQQIGRGFKRIKPGRNRGTLSVTSHSESSEQAPESTPRRRGGRIVEDNCNTGADGTRQELTNMLDQSHQMQEQIAMISASVAQLQNQLNQMQHALKNSLEKLDGNAETLTIQPPTANGPSSLHGPCDVIRRRSYTDDNELSKSQSLLTPSAQTQLRQRANTDSRVIMHSNSFMRVSDLDITEKDSLSTCSKDFFLLNENITLILNKLSNLGFTVATDESDRFEATRETQRLLSRYDSRKRIPGWPVCPWHAATEKNTVLSWTGGVLHNGFGSDWPVVKARGIVETSPRELVTLLLDSSQLKKYNKMSLGRDNVLVIQEGVETSEHQSAYGFAGDARIMRALNKPRLLPKTLEMLSLWYTKPLADASDSYMIVNRSVWEDDRGHPKTEDSHMLRMDMLLSVFLIRPCLYDGCSELTTITHIYTPGVPEMIAKRMAPGAAANLIKDIQALFR